MLKYQQLNTNLVKTDKVDKCLKKLGRVSSFLVFTEQSTHPTKRLLHLPVALNYPLNLAVGTAVEVLNKILRNKNAATFFCFV